MAGNRIRSVRPELLEHPRFAALSDGAVRLWTGLLPCWDDEGRSLGSVGYVHGRVYFARAKNRTMIGRELAELEASGWLIRYQVAGVDYLAVRGWSDPDSATYQYIKAPRPSKLPAPTPIPWPKPDAKDGAKPDAKPWSLDQDQEQEKDQEREREREREPARAIPPPAPAPPPPPEPPPAPPPAPPAAAPPPAPEAVAQQPETPGTCRPLPPGESAWHRRMRWWGAMLEADARIRAAGIEPNAPTLPKAPAGENERNLHLCERQLVDGGATPDEVDAKMQHIVLVAEAEALRSDNRSRRWFKPSCIWDPARAARAVDTSLAEASRPRSRAGAPTPTPTPPARRAPTPQPAPVIPAEDRAGPAELAEALKRLGIAVPVADGDADAPREAPS